MAEIDPFKHELQLTKWEWFRTYFLTIFLVPIRILLILMILMFTSVISKIALFIHYRSNSIKEPFASCWIKSTQKLVQFLMSTALRIFGLRVTYKGDLASVNKAPIIVTAPHSTFFDANIIFWIGNPCAFVIAEEYSNAPMLGSILQLFQPIY